MNTLQVTNQAGQIEFKNFEELKCELRSRVTPFETLVLTEDQYAEAKKTRASFNNLKKAIDTNRKEIKKSYMAPYTAYESQCKELIEIIDRGVTNVDNFIKEQDQKWQDQRVQDIKDFYNSLHFDAVPLKQIADRKWLNKTCSEKQWKEQLSGKVESIKAELKVLEAIPAEDPAQLRLCYLECLDIATAQANYKAHMEALERARAMEQKPHAITPTPVEQPQETQQQAPQVNPAELPMDAIMTRTFRVTATKANIIALSDFMNDNGIKFEKVEEK